MICKNSVCANYNRIYNDNCGRYATTTTTECDGFIPLGPTEKTIDEKKNKCYREDCEDFETSETNNCSNFFMVSSCPALILEKPERPMEKVEKEFEDWLDKLVAAIVLAGGVRDRKTWERKTMKELFVNLKPNGITFNFKVDKSFTDREY
jgi:hypothetical protein